jgi:hypothetical protein
MGDRLNQIEMFDWTQCLCVTQRSPWIRLF